MFNPQVPTSLESWEREPSSKVLRASLNSFGYGGTNAHVILEEAESYLSSRNPSQCGTNGVQNGIDKTLNGAMTTNGAKLSKARVYSLIIQQSSQ